MEKSDKKDTDESPSAFVETESHKKYKKESNEKLQSWIFTFTLIFHKISFIIELAPLFYICATLSTIEDPPITLKASHMKFPEMIRELSRSEILSKFEDVIKRTEVEYKNPFEKEFTKELEKFFQGYDAEFYRRDYSFQLDLESKLRIKGVLEKNAVTDTNEFRKFELNTQSMMKLMREKMSFGPEFAKRVKYNVMIFEKLMKGHVENGTPLTDQEISKIKSATIYACKTAPKSHIFPYFTLTAVHGRRMSFEIINWENIYAKYCASKNNERQHPPIFIADIACFSSLLYRKYPIYQLYNDFKLAFIFRMPLGNPLYDPI